MRGHSLVHQQKVGVVPRPAFTIYAVANVTVIANASKLIFTGRHARCFGRAEIRIVYARGLRPTRETVTVVTLESGQIVIIYILYHKVFKRKRVIAAHYIIEKKYYFLVTFLNFRPS